MVDDSESSAHDHAKSMRADSLLDQLSAGSFVENLPVGIHLYKLEDDDRLVYINGNPAADRILGITCSQYIGKTLEEAFPSSVSTSIPTEYRKVARTGQPFSIERHRTKEAGAFEIKAFRVAPNTIAAMFSDISEKSRIVDTRNRSEEKYRTLFTSANDSIFITDMNGCIVDVNPAACREYGYSREEFLSMKATDLLHEDHISLLDGLLSDRNDSGSIRGETVDLRKDGSSMHVEVSANIFHFSDEKHILVFVKNISDIRQTVKELDRAKHELETVISKTPLAIAIVEHGANVRYVNPVFEQMFGYRQHEVSTSKIWFDKLYPDPAYRDKVQNIWLDIVSSPETISDESYEFELTAKNGQKKLIRFKIGLFEEKTFLLCARQGALTWR